MRPALTFLLFLLINPFCHTSAQTQPDTTFTEPPDSLMERIHSPTKATIMSACLPGLGQIYNRKYWKVPIIYVGFGVLSYFLYTNTDKYLDFKCAYIESVNGCTQGNYSELVNRYSADELLTGREYYRRNLEVTCLLTALWYIVNILDATVDAHLYTYNISKNLSLNIQPAVTHLSYRGGVASGLQLSIRF